MEFLKLRRDNASLGKRIEEVMRGGLVKEEKKKIRSHGRGIVIIVVKKERKKVVLQQISASTSLL